MMEQLNYDAITIEDCEKAYEFGIIFDVNDGHIVGFHKESEEEN